KVKRAVRGENRFHSGIATESKRAGINSSNGLEGAAIRFKRARHSRNARRPVAQAAAHAVGREGKAAGSIGKDRSATLIIGVDDERVGECPLDVRIKSHQRRRVVRAHQEHELAILTSRKTALKEEGRLQAARSIKANGPIGVRETHRRTGAK